MENVTQVVPVDTTVPAMYAFNVLVLALLAQLQLARPAKSTLTDSSKPAFLIAAFRFFPSPLTITAQIVRVCLTAKLAKQLPIITMSVSAASSLMSFFKGIA